MILIASTVWFTSCGPETGSYELDYSIWTIENPSEENIEYYKSEGFPINEDGNYYCYAFWVKSTPSKHTQYLNQVIFHPDKQGVGNVSNSLKNLSLYERAMNDGFFHEFKLSADNQQHLCMNFKDNPTFLQFNNKTGYRVCCGTGYAPRDLWENNRSEFLKYETREQEDHRWIWIEANQSGFFEINKADHLRDVVKVDFWTDKNYDGYGSGEEWAGAWAKGYTTAYPDYGYIYTVLTLMPNGKVDTTWEVHDYDNRKVDRSMNFEANASAVPGSYLMFDAPGCNE